jgi:salicylate hydroxylase
MALEDAWVLADRLDRMDEAEALASYRAARRGRVAKVVSASQSNARNYHLRAPVAGAAHLALRLGHVLNPTAALKRFDWLYGYDATANH